MEKSSRNGNKSKEQYSLTSTMESHIKIIFYGYKMGTLGKKKSLRRLEKLLDEYKEED